MSHTAYIGPAFGNILTLNFFAVSISTVPCHGIGGVQCRNS